MKKIILVILVALIYISSMNCGSSTYKSIDTDDIAYEDIYKNKEELYNDGYNIMLDISKSMRFLYKKLNYRKRWNDALHYVVSGFGGVTAAILAANSSEPSNSKNTFAIFGACFTFASGIAMSFITPSESDIACVEEWGKIKNAWLEAEGDCAKKKMVINLAVLFANEHGLLTKQYAEKIKKDSAEKIKLLKINK